MTTDGCTLARGTLAAAIIAIATFAAAACGEGGSTGPDGSPVPIRLTLENVPAADAPTMDGYRYAAWVVEGDGTIRPAGVFDPGSSGTATVESPVSSPEHVMVTVELAGESPPERPAQEKLVGGRFDGDSAVLTIDRYLTAGVPLVEDPGTHALFTPSDNRELGYPSNEDSGLWMFNVEGDTANSDFYVRFSNLSRGWTYEGWIVRDHGSEDECWLSYGKFQPDSRGKAAGHDDLAFGPYSGRLQYMQDPGEIIDTPGGDFVGNPHGYPAPCGMDLPIDLNGDKNSGVESRWTHVITIEPAQHEEDETGSSPDDIENPLEREPFFVRPYRNPIGQGYADEPRDIQFYPNSLPRGAAVIERDGG